MPGAGWLTPGRVYTLSYTAGEPATHLGLVLAREIEPQKVEDIF